MIFTGLDDIPNDRVMKALTGFTKDQFKKLLETFESTYRDLIWWPPVLGFRPGFPRPSLQF
jgi:hypothetical protein